VTTITRRRFSTKSPLLVRDIDLIASSPSECDSPRISRSRRWTSAHARQTESRTPSPRARVDALKKLAASGIAVGVVIAPPLPGIDDDPEQIKVILETANSVGVESVDTLPQHLRALGSPNWSIAWPMISSEPMRLRRAGGLTE
jgi:DNA repair photolyase